MNDSRRFAYVGAGLLAALSWVAALPAAAIPIIYEADLSGPAEFPPNASPGTGHATVRVRACSFAGHQPTGCTTRR